MSNETLSKMDIDIVDLFTILKMGNKHIVKSGKLHQIGKELKNIKKKINGIFAIFYCKSYSEVRKIKRFMKKILAQDNFRDVALIWNTNINTDLKEIKTDLVLVY